jgi:hypothetical protein
MTSADISLEILTGVVRGDSAILDVKEPKSGYAMLRLVRMQKVESGWVYDDAVTGGFY